VGIDGRAGIGCATAAGFGADGTPNTDGRWVGTGTATGPSAIGGAIGASAALTNGTTFGASGRFIGDRRILYAMALNAAEHSSGTAHFHAQPKTNKSKAHSYHRSAMAGGVSVLSEAVGHDSFTNRRELQKYSAEMEKRARKIFSALSLKFLPLRPTCPHNRSMLGVINGETSVKVRS
jgi:hypothetical protein